MSWANLLGLNKQTSYLYFVKEINNKTFKTRFELTYRPESVTPKPIDIFSEILNLKLYVNNYINPLIPGYSNKSKL